MCLLNKEKNGRKATIPQFKKKKNGGEGVFRVEGLTQAKAARPIQEI